MTGPTFNLELDAVIDNLIDEWVIQKHANDEREAEQIQMFEDEE